MRSMRLAPCSVSPAFAPGQVRSQSPTQNSSCFCSAIVHGLGGAVIADCCETAIWRERSARRIAIRNLVILFDMLSTPSFRRRRSQKVIFTDPPLIRRIGGPARFLVHLLS